MIGSKTIYVVISQCIFMRCTFCGWLIITLKSNSMLDVLFQSIPTEVLGCSPLRTVAGRFELRQMGRFSHQPRCQLANRKLLSWNPPGVHMPRTSWTSPQHTQADWESNLFSFWLQISSLNCQWSDTLSINSRIRLLRSSGVGKN